MNMTCAVIDLDKYEFKNKPASLRGFDDEYNGLLSDFQTIDAEIIDYGISEDEFDETSPTFTEQVLSSTTNTHKQGLVNSSSKPISSKSKCACVKIVDCDKYPSYYRKYEHQILKRKYFEAIKHAKYIVERMKNGTSKPYIVIDDDSSSDRSDNSQISVKKDYNDEIATHKKASVVSKSSFIDNEYSKLDQDRDREIIRKEIFITKTNPSMIDVKKNKYLVGMKVQKISERHQTPGYKENCKMVEKNSKTNEKVRKQTDKHFCNYSVKGGDTSFETMRPSINLAFDNLQTHENSDDNKDQRKQDVENVHTNKKLQLKNCVGLKCSLQIRSPKILMKIKKIKSSEENESDKTHKKSRDSSKKIEDSVQFSLASPVSNGHIIGNNKTENSERIYKKDERLPVNACINGTKYKPMPKSKRTELEKYVNKKHLNDIEHKPNKKTELPVNTCSNVTKYKPMPKSKRTELEKYISKKHPNDIEHKPNKNTELHKIISTVTPSFTYTNNISTYNEKMYATQKKNETPNRSNEQINCTNNITEKVQKIMKTIPNKYKTEHTKNFMKKKPSKNKVTLDQSLRLNNVHNTDLANKSEVALKCKATKIKPRMASDTKSIASCNKDFSSDCLNSSLENKNMDSNDLPNLVQLNKTVRGNYTPSSLSNVVTTKNSLTISNKELQSFGTRNIMPKPTKTSKTVSNQMLSPSQLISQHQRKETTRKNHSKCCLYATKNNNNDVFLHSNINNKSNVRLINLPSNVPYEPQERIPIVVNLPRSNYFYRGSSIKNGENIKTQLNENQRAKTIANLPQPNILIPQDIKSQTEQDNSSVQNYKQHILNDNNISQECTSSSVKNNTPQMPLKPVLPNKTPLPPDVLDKRPNIIRRPYYYNYGVGHQRPLLRPNRNRFSAPNIAPYWQTPYVIRPQSPLRQVHHLKVYSYQQPNYAYLPRLPEINNVQRLRWGNLNQDTGINYNQNNNIQQTVYNNFKFQEMSRNAHMPPGISDVQPNNGNWQYGSNCSAFPPPHTSPPPHIQNTVTDSENISIIGKNFTGLINKINIPSSIDSILNDKVDKKEAKQNQENTNTDAKKFTDTNTVDNFTNKTCTSNSENITAIISTKSEMLEELEKAMLTVESPEKSDLKRSYPNESCDQKPKDVIESRPGPLSKKVKLIYDLHTPQRRNTKEMPKIGYSPPILPIKTFQNMLSEVLTGVSNVSMEMNGKEKNLPSKLTSKNVSRTEEDAKKLSLEEYKKRSFKSTLRLKINK